VGSQAHVNGRKNALLSRLRRLVSLDLESERARERERERKVY